MLGLCCNKTYGEMKNHHVGDDSGDNDINEDGNDDDSAASGLGADGSIIYPITMLWSLLGLVEEYWGRITTALQPQCHMYLSDWIYLPYKYPINTILIMCHKLLYAKIGVLELCC